MKLLPTSAGVKNPGIRDALVDLLGKPIADSDALCIPTAQYGHPMCGPATARRFITGQIPLPMCDLGWESLGVLELTALPSIGEKRWIPGSEFPGLRASFVLPERLLDSLIHSRLLARRCSSRNRSVGTPS